MGLYLIYAISSFIDKKSRKLSKEDYFSARIYYNNRDIKLM